MCRKNQKMTENKIELVQCQICEYKTIRTNRCGEPCSKCGGLVKILSKIRGKQ